MKLLITTFLCLMLALPAWADQQTTVLSEQTKLGKTESVLPYLDGATDTALEQEANSLIRTTAAELQKRNGGSVSYQVMLNRPSLVSLLLTATNGSQQAYEGLNIDLTTGKEFTVTDFFVANDAVKAAVGDYSNVLFSEEGLLVRSKKGVAYEKLVPYSELTTSLRIGDAGRIMQIARLTAKAEGKTLHIPESGLVALKLDSNPSTGYGWEMSCSSTAVSKVGSSFTIPSGTPEKMVGVPGTEIIVLAVTQPGSYKVTMTYKRPWEKLSLKSFSFTVIAD